MPTSPHNHQRRHRSKTINSATPALPHNHQQHLVTSNVAHDSRTPFTRSVARPPIHHHICCAQRQRESRAELIRQAALIIWDEAPMVKRATIEAVNRTFQDIMNNFEPFGSKVMVFGGYFRRVLPVVPRATRQQIVNESSVRSYLWEKMHKLHLPRNMRVQNDHQFAEYSIKIGNGTERTVGEDFISLPKDIVLSSNNNNSPELNLINFVFSDLPKMLNHQNI
ncbi:uncharacterized protein LOC111380627 [Olea europaea var. sylvestris]|uniref:uncharacterized protein LOC111380627 n=1 Tax=Olea europaea var. sylvestris TaxID=158386 RepID=UPI000C1CE74F|nr:uncharacterized protein LOC111380627 [Olea europaea var. sylvestris]